MAYQREFKNLIENVVDKYLDSDDDSCSQESVNIEENKKTAMIQEIRQKFFQEILPDVKKELLKTVHTIMNEMGSAFTIKLSTFEENMIKQNKTICLLAKKLEKCESELPASTETPLAPDQKLDNEKVINADTLLNKIRKKIRFEEERYFFSTMLVKGFNNKNIRARNRYDKLAAEKVLETMDSAGDWVYQATMVLFNKDYTNVRLTFSSPKMCENVVKHLSICSADIKRRDGIVPFSFSALVPPKYNNQKKILFNMGSKLKISGKIFKFTFISRRGQLGIRCYTRGQKSQIILYNEVVGRESEENDIFPND